MEISSIMGKAIDTMTEDYLRLYKPFEYQGVIHLEPTLAKHFLKQALTNGFIEGIKIGASTKKGL